MKIKRVVILTVIFITAVFLIQYFLVWFAFASIGLVGFIPVFYLNWATRVPVEELALKARAKDIDLQLMINTCVYAVLFIPTACWYLKRKKEKH
ncbi:MAG: hypothetical protein JWR19_3212 [Pedosphaera sp.]|jgi:hypothetical protein|nr:hypothetical protein [Pedosphaera sp.]